ncbi:hypothetical protein CVT24_010707 [Panaeolus cyanescens]|uniref:Uncharacterized protein n=1 Tax=Panaeolus cyanescens TaxID=181874 RepID=A0A409YM46_9AGAR|nr:hypothetical protein CVT24_010707 [Panaeolus cyanescens]
MTSYSTSIPVQVEDYPNLLWVAIPSAVLVSAYFVRKWYLGRQLRLYGIGKGAPGFQTNVKRIAITPEIAARLKKGEKVTPEEIEKASREAEEREKAGGMGLKSGGSGPVGRGVVEERDDRLNLKGGIGGGMNGGLKMSGSGSESSEGGKVGAGNGKGKEKGNLKNVDDEWLPENLTRAGGGGKAQRRKGKK